MPSRHTHHSKVITAFVRIPEPLEDGRVRCAACSRPVAVTKNGNLRKHRTPAGEDCAYWANYGEHVSLDALPDVALPKHASKPGRTSNRTDDYGIVPRSGYCQVDDCEKYIGPDRTLCGYHLATRKRA